ncbi:hypothetical protein [Pelistega ratti]|uniref:hypothetical protein n=1 Tax=Pelistega ratti TaxID=2652177 RepID=UPI001357793C|nr:hypothetical protein [Pelistega ratti]
MHSTVKPTLYVNTFASNNVMHSTKNTLSGIKKSILTESVFARLAGVGIALVLLWGIVAYALGWL